MLQGHRAYLSGPMGFVVSRENEMKFGWRSRVGKFLGEMGVVVFDPWNKPRVKWFYEYGKETGLLKEIDEKWSSNRSGRGKRNRAECAEKFKDTMHIDLRMVDTSDFLIAYCPTNIYSVGTVHEIILASQQHKPVLVVSPHVGFPTLEKLRSHLQSDKRAQQLLAKLEREVPIKPNDKGMPSLWYMALLGEHSFFDGFGFAKYRKQYGWQLGPLDVRENASPPRRPLLPFLKQLDSGEKPTRFDLKTGSNIEDEDWLLLEWM